MRHTAPLTLMALATALAGCPAFLVDRGEVLDPTRSLEAPTVSALPRADRYVELAARWRRETRVGIGGFVEATLVDPGLAAAQIAHSAALQSLTPAGIADMVAARWPVLYGTMLDRFPIDLEWRFDEQFISNRRVLDPANWQFTLVASDGGRHVPLGTGVLRALPTPQDGAWIGAARVWFPYRDPASRSALLGGSVSWLRLELRHPSGVGDATWRFRTDY